MSGRIPRMFSTFRNMLAVRGKVCSRDGVGGDCHGEYFARHCLRVGHKVCVDLSSHGLRISDSDSDDKGPVIGLPMRRRISGISPRSRPTGAPSRTRRRTLSGWAIAKAIAKYPPMELPTRSMRSASMVVARSKPSRRRRCDSRRCGSRFDSSTRIPDGQG
jgi:hypothetical protein